MCCLLWRKKTNRHELFCLVRISHRIFWTSETLKIVLFLFITFQHSFPTDLPSGQKTAICFLPFNHHYCILVFLWRRGSYFKDVFDFMILYVVRFMGWGIIRRTGLSLKTINFFYVRYLQSKTVRSLCFVMQKKVCWVTIQIGS